MMKQLFVILGMVVATSASAQKNGDGILFEISGNGLNVPSYILGSNHEVSGDFVHQIPMFDKIYKSVSRTCFETDLNEAVDQSAESNAKAQKQLQAQGEQQDLSFMMLPEDSTYAKIIGDDKAAEIDRVMTGLLTSYVPNIRPVYAAMLLQNIQQVMRLGVKALTGSQFTSIDYYVHAMSLNDKKKVLALEPRSLQDSLIQQMHQTPRVESMYDQMMAFYAQCHLADTRQQSSNLVKVYYMRGLGSQSVNTQVESSQRIQKEMQKIYPKYEAADLSSLMAVNMRNELWMKKIPTYMQEGSTLFVVGVAHLFPYRDSKGLISSLRKKGYTVKPVAPTTPLLQVTVNDADMRKATFLLKFANGVNDTKGLSQMLFDEKNVATYSDELRASYNAARIFFGNDEYNIFLMPGKTLQAVVNKENGKPAVTLTGDKDLVDACNVMNLYRHSYSYPKFFARVDTDPAAKTTYEEKLQQLDDSFAEINAKANQLKLSEIADQIKLENKCEYLRFRLTLMRSKLREEDKDLSTDSEYQRYLDMIDTEDERYESFNLISNYLDGHVSKQATDAGLSEYGIEAMRVIQDKIKNPSIRLQLQATVAQKVLTEENKDIDKFWNAFKEFGDKDVVSALESKVNSLKNTESGMQAPVCEFTDIDGRVHSSSDYAGKLLYIDFWATWCGPCKQEIPHLAKLVDHFKDNDKVAFISISIDTNQQAWEKMIKEDNPSWPQFIANQAQNLKLSSDWGINAIPRFIIINPDGTIQSPNAFRPSDPDAIQKINALIQ